METLSAPPGALQFPARCVECGARPTRSFALVLPRGLAPGALEAPLCARCGERKSLAQAGWVLGAIAAGIACVVLLGFLVDAVVPADVQRRVVGPVVTFLFLLGAIPVWLSARRGRRSFHRRFSAVWVEGAGPAGAIRLGFRAAELCREVAAASGLAAAAAATYRTPAAPAPAPAFAPRENPIPGWAVALFGLLVLPAGIAEYVSFGKAEARGETISRVWVEILIYDLFGRAGVLALFFVVGALFIGLGAALWRKAQRREA